MTLCQHSQNLRVALLSVAMLVAIASELRAQAAPASDARPTTVRRFALIVGANDGGRERVQLQYAARDAKTMAEVLEELGGVTPRDRLVILDPDAAAFKDGVALMRSRLEAARSGDDRLELILYYSGHSDEEGLLLGGERLGYSKLRSWLKELPADVRIAILDSCSSGALTRSKGGKRRPPFLVDASAQVKGHAILTSASENEAAQESDRLGASFFTHYLVSGLRGAADATGDGRVTLNEAYQFAYHETLAGTESTRGGAQHPAYDIALAGTGDLVMTDLRGSGAGLIFEEKSRGRFYLRDQDGRLVAELRKEQGRRMELALEPGEYIVTRDLDGSLHRGSLRLGRGEFVRVAALGLVAIDIEPTVERGGERVEPLALEPKPPVTEASDEPQLRHSGFSLALLPGVAVMGSEGPNVVRHVGVNLIAGTAARLDGVEFGFGANWVYGDVFGAQVALGLNHAGGRMRGIQVAQLANVVRGDAEGVQLATGLNYVGGKASYLQMATGGNIAMDRGLGVQVATGFNWADTFWRGIQFSSGLNYAREIEGGQASMLNVGGDVQGVQLGLLNIAGKVKGTQIGLINYHDDISGVPLGLLNISRNGIFRVASWTSDTAYGNLGLKIGSRYVYTLIMGSAHSDSGPTHWSMGFGVGGHIPFDPFFLDIDVVGTGWVPGKDWSVVPKFRAMLGWQIMERLAITAGPTLNISIDDRRQGGEYELATPKRIGDDESDELFIWPGFAAGVQF